MGRSLLLPAALAMVLGVAAAATAEAPPTVREGFEGRLMFDDKVLPGGRVYFYNSFEDLAARKPVAVSSPANETGAFELAVPPGSYWLAAKVRAAGAEDGVLSPGDLFSYHGSNPISVAPGKLTHVGFILLKKEQEIAYEEIPAADSGSLAGVVNFKGQPMAGATISLYLNAAENFRGPVYASPPPTGKAGTFRLDLLPENKYYLIARKRASGAQAGPINDGDYFGFFLDNPVAVKNGTLARITFELGLKTVEIGKEDSLFRESATRVRGKIADKDGKAVKGTYAFAYREKAMANKRPAFISKEVDAQGTYVLYLSEGGTYYLGARSGYGAGPVAGEWNGRYDANPDHALIIETGGMIDGVDMTVKPVEP